MSVNLHCKQLDLYQTPTYITYMCYSNNDGGWRGIKYRYKEWVKGHLYIREDVKEVQAQIDGHLKRIESFEKLDFFIG
jgi:hypothetical protein